MWQNSTRILFLQIRLIECSQLRLIQCYPIFSTQRMPAVVRTICACKMYSCPCRTISLGCMIACIAIFSVSWVSLNMLTGDLLVVLYSGLLMPVESCLVMFQKRGGGGCCCCWQGALPLAPQLLRHLPLLLLVARSDSMGESSVSMRCSQHYTFQNFMFVDRFREIVKRVSQFRSQALLGRYVKGLKMLEELQAQIGRLRQQAQPKMQVQLDQLKAVLEEEGAIVQQIYQSFLEKQVIPPLPNPRQQAQAQQPNSHYEPLRKSEISKWSSSAEQPAISRKDIPNVAQSYVYQTKQKSSEQELVKQPTISRGVSSPESVKDPNHTGDVKDIIEEKLVAPFTMPQFFKRISCKVVLLFGPEETALKLTARVVASKTGCTLKYITEADLRSGTSLEQISRLSSTPNILSLVEQADQLSDSAQRALSQLAKSFQSNKFVKNILILTSSRPQRIITELLLASNLNLLMPSGDQHQDTPYQQFQLGLSRTRMASDA